MSKAFSSIKDSLRRPSFVFVALMVLSLAVLLAAVTVSDGRAYPLVFFQDDTPDMDVGMDFFNSYIETSDGVPYSRYHTLYPPLANLFFYVLQASMPDRIAVRWAQDHDEVVHMRGTELDIRFRQEALLPFVIYSIAAAVALLYLSERFLKGSVPRPKAVALCFLFSFGNLYAIERGNITLIALVLSFVFAMFYDSESRVMRELAIIALALAAGLKLYPAIFGLILIKDRRWGQAVRAVIYGVLAFILPFFVFEGVAAIGVFFRELLRFAGDGKGVFGLGAIVQFVVHILDGAFGIRGLNEGLILTIVRVVSIVLLLVSFIRSRKRETNWLILALILVFFQEAHAYTLGFFLIPFGFFLRDNEALSAQNLPEFVFYLIVTLPLVTPMVSQTKTVHIVIILIAMCLISLIEVIRCIFAKRQR